MSESPASGLVVGGCVSQPAHFMCRAIHRSAGRGEFFAAGVASRVSVENTVPR